MVSVESRCTEAAGATLDGLFRRSARLFATRTAVVDPERGARLSYEELDRRTNQVANSLLGWDLRRGDRVAVLSEPSAGFVETYLAAARLGITVVALNVRMHPSELSMCLERARPRVLLYSELYRSLAEVISHAESLSKLVCFDGDGPEDYLGSTRGANADDPGGTAMPDDIHNIIFTSGTTGVSKGAMISQRAAAARAMRIAHCFQLTESDAFLGWLPLYHCGGDESLYATLLSGGRYVPLAKVDAGGLLRLIDDEKATWTALVPGVINEFLNHPERDRFNLSSLRFAIGYGNLCPDAAERAANELGIEFCDIFGQTESSYLVAVGRILPGAPPDFRKTPQPMLDLRLVDDAMNDVPLGELGECVVRGATVMTGYVDDPGATAEAFRGGWLHTGDVLVQHEDGTLTYADRRKYLIKTGGENVYPSEVEQAIAAHEAVAEVCAFGVPDERWGETIKAAVVLHESGSASAQELADWCSVRLARYKRPHYIEFFGPKELPRNASGKVDRLELASRALVAGHRVT